MIGFAASLAVRAAACALATWAAWRAFGASGIVFAAPLIAVAFAGPLIELAAAARRGLRHAQWREVEGRHYAFRGRPVRVVDDADQQRWIRLADIRAIVGFTAGDNALALAYPGGVRRIGRPAEGFIGEDALLAHLGKERGPDALRLHHWVEREIVFPARRERERLGARARPAERDTGD